MTGWALFLDYLIVIALSALFLPHYLAGALQVGALDRNPWDVVVAVGVDRRRRRDPARPPPLVLRARDRRPRARRARPSSCWSSSASRSSSRRTRSRTAPRSGTAPTFSSLALLDPARDARLHGPRDGREPRRGGAPAGRRPAALALRRDRHRRHHVRRDRGRRPLGVPGPADRARHDAGCARRSSASPTQIRAHTSATLGDTIRFFVGASGALILLASVTTSISGFSPPRLLARRARPAAARVRPPAPPDARLAAGDRQRHGDLERDRDRHRRSSHHDVAFLASVFSFGVLLAFTATQLAVIRLRIAEPDLPRPYRTPLNIRIRGARDPAARRSSARSSPSRSGSSRSSTHPGARYAGPAWLAVGLVVYVAVRRSHGEGLTERVVAPDSGALRRRAALPPDPRAR